VTLSRLPRLSRWVAGYVTLLRLRRLCNSPTVVTSAKQMPQSPTCRRSKRSAQDEFLMPKESERLGSTNSVHIVISCQGRADAGNSNAGAGQAVARLCVVPTETIFTKNFDYFWAEKEIHGWTHRQTITVNRLFAPPIRMNACFAPPSPASQR